MIAPHDSATLAARERSASGAAGERTASDVAGERTWSGAAGGRPASGASPAHEGAVCHADPSGGGAALYALLPSPIGEVLVTGTERSLTGLGFADRVALPVESRRSDDAFARVRVELDAYWAGELRAFSVAMDPPGTPWQREVWQALVAVPFGTTLGYGELAARLGRPAAARAVGAANGRNPISVIVPCHRLVGAAGALTGYGGGLERKRWLLDHEAAVAEGAPRG